LRADLLDGRPVILAEIGNGLVVRREPLQKPDTSASTNASTTRTGLLSSMKSSRHSGNSVDCPRSAPSMNRFIDCPRKSRGESYQRPRFCAARVISSSTKKDHGYEHRRAVTPPSAIRPPWQDTDQDEEEKNRYFQRHGYPRLLRQF
jgi:hypothetical protein